MSCGRGGRYGVRDDEVLYCVLAGFTILHSVACDRWRILSLRISQEL